MERWTSFSQLGRDLRVLRLRAQGGHLSPLVRGEAKTSKPERVETKPDLGFRSVRIETRVQETPDAVSLKLKAVDAPLAPHRAGQFLTLEVVVDERTYRRAYSISSAEGEPIQVSIKRIDGGVVSTHLTTRAKAGDILRVLGPSGTFGYTSTPEHALIVAGGSGITPCIAIAETLLRDGSRVTLVYGSRSWEDIIFRERLEELSEQYDARLTVDYVTEAAHAQSVEGRLDAKTLRERLKAVGAPKNAAVFLCGPAAMMEAARPVFLDLGFENVREERFVSARPKPVRRVAEGHMITILRPGGRIDAPSAGTLLESGLAAGVDMPFSCSVGGCATCKVKLVEGEVRHDELSCLSDDEKSQGYVLACCAEAATSCTIELLAKGKS
ncbi:MAG: ring-1,2-phenylacetyl-CoA epoxidase subunit PaaE [Polyangiales bacterium]|jgi:ring-1,2-phenylacetyl-CoA epoxidase subunit PaaE